MDKRACDAWGELPTEEPELSIPAFLTQNTICRESAVRLACFAYEAEHRHYKNHASEISRIRSRRKRRKAFLVALAAAFLMLIVGRIEQGGM